MIFCIPGPPIPKQRPRVVLRKGQGHVAITPKETEAYERKVKLCALSAGVRRLEGPVRMELSFYLPDLVRRDWENLAKSVCDALNGIAYEDDSQVVEAHVVKQVDRDNPRAVVTVEAA